MKYKYGKYYFDQESQEKKYIPRIYTDFYCSLDEWTNLGRGKDNFMRQLRSKIVDDGLLNDEQHKYIKYYISKDRKKIYDESDIERNINIDKVKEKVSKEINKILGFNPKELFNDITEKEFNNYITENELTLLDKPMYFDNNGLKLYRLSFDRVGRRDGLDTEIYSANIIKHVIKYITHKDANVEFYSWKGTIDHIEISFDNCEMPNIIVLIDSYCNSSTNRTLIHCIDAIYKTLKNKANFYYEQYHKKYYNNNWDKIFNYSEENNWYNKHEYGYYDQYRLTSKRRYSCTTIYYEK